MDQVFKDRSAAGRSLAAALAHLRPQKNLLVLALPRGGVPVGAEVARGLGASFDVLLVRKLGTPGQPELAMGAIASNGVRVLNRDVIDALRVDAGTIEKVAATELVELERRERAYRGTKPRPEVRGRYVIIVDDGLATGATMQAAVEAVRQQQPRKVIVAIPVGAAQTVQRLRGFADEIVCLSAPASFMAVGQWYQDFSQVTDAEVRRALAAAGDVAGESDPRVIALADVALDADLAVPATAAGIVVFAHGSGSSRRSRRNRHVAELLNNAGLATLLFDLLSPDEAEDDQRTGALRFDIDLLSRRLIGAVDWVGTQPDLRGYPIGLFGASTGAAAALNAAAERPQHVAAVVSRGGRPDLAAASLPRVRAPVLLIVGGLDAPVIELNEQAAACLTCSCQLEIVPGATHLFEEPGRLDHVAELAADWFLRHLGAGTATPGGGPH
jgi:putative phosphoribosyl transferase